MPRSERNSALFLAAPAVVFVGAAFMWPMARLCTLAFSRGTQDAAGIVRLFTDHYDRRALVNSVGFSIVIAMVSVGVCLPAAMALARRPIPGRGLLRTLFAVPLSLSGVVVGFFGIAMLGNAGALPSLLHAEWLRGTAYGVPGLAVVYLYFEIPRATLTLEAAFASFDDRVLDAARTLGARPWQVARWVIIPACWPAVRAALGITFAAALGSLGAALILAARFPLLPVEMYRAFTGTLDDGLAAAMALTLAVAASVALVATQRKAA